MLRVFNTLTKNLTPLKPRGGRKLSLFVCGPTVYDFSHIGHAKTYVQFDMMVKYLRLRGLEVFYLQNITDIDDKILQRAAEHNEPWKALSERFEKEYRWDMEALGVDSVTQHARATEYIPQIIRQVTTLLAKGAAYEIDDGIYFDLSKFPRYGKLSGRTSLVAEDAVSRIDESKGKRNKGDFCLWKRSRQGEPSWDSPWFPGRPGWHIEDTAITETFFGPQYDVHGGARDLIFPHHEAEIAQMEAASGKKPLVKYWLHTGFLTVNGQKMSKSLGNFITIRDAVGKWGAQALRWLFASAHYRSAMDFSGEAIAGAQGALERLQNTVLGVKARAGTARAGPGKAAPKADTAFSKKVSLLRKRFFEEMDDDFNTPKAAALLFALAHELNTLEGSRAALETGLRTFEELLGVFGIVLDTDVDVPGDVQRLVAERGEARAEKRWVAADRLRAAIEKLGFSVDDTAAGPVVRQKKPVKKN